MGLTDGQGSEEIGVLANFRDISLVIFIYTYLLYLYWVSYGFVQYLSLYTVDLARGCYYPPTILIVGNSKSNIEVD